jgi:hypothetical protein
MYPLDPTERIKFLEQELATTKSRLTTAMPVTPVTVPVVTDSMNNTPVNPNVNNVVSQATIADAEQALRKFIQDEIQKALGSAVSTKQEPMDYGKRLLLSIGSALSEEEQIWLSNVSNQDDIPDFLATSDGQAFTRRFFLFYKDYKEKKCK